MRNIKKAWSKYKKDGFYRIFGRILLKIASQINKAGERLYEAKSIYECPLCSKRMSEWKQYHRPITPNTYRIERACICPHCRSFDRTRAIWLYFKKTNILNSKLRFLHFAPESNLRKHLKKHLGKNYVTTDLKRKDVDVKSDMTNLVFADKSFDIIYCSHVLEHIKDDIKAMQELYRVLDFNGSAIIQVPVKGAVTFEDDTIISREDRDKYFGHFDHLRYYGRDIAERLRSCGFDVQEVIIPQVINLDDYQIERYNIRKNERMFLCRKFVVSP
jgi:predicted SAM-dependent methyltransferase